MNLRTFIPPIDILLFKWNESKLSVFSINDEGEIKMHDVTFNI